MKKKKIFFLVIFLILLIGIIGVSYALLQKDIIGSNRKIIYQVGDLEVKLDESGSKDISLVNATPQEESDGLSNEPYSFSLVNNATTDLKYTIYLEDDSDAKNKCGTDCELVTYNFIRYNLSNDNSSLKTENLQSSSTELYTGTISSKSTDKFNLRVWLSIDADNTAMNKYYFGKIKVVINQGDDYCIRNGFNTLSDCMLVMNNHESSIESAKQNITAKGTPDFSKTATTDEGLFMAEDDEGASYYYRGAVKNNYVSFAGFIWRIIRRNGDGSIRMIYAGKKTNDTGEATTIGKSQFNSKWWDPTYVGYKYNEKFSLHENNGTTEYNWFTNTQKYNFGTGYTFDKSTKKFTLTGTIKQLTWKDNHDEIVAGKLYSCLNTECNVVYKVTGYQNDTTMTVQPISYSSDTYNDAVKNNVNSAIKEMLDNWYKHNMIKYTMYLADETFCNDRSVISGTGYLVTSLSRYGSYNRLVSNKSPSLKCMQDNDKFRVSNSSAKLEYPVALITADEVSMAGGRGHHDASYSPNSDFYLYNTKAYWTMSPSVFSSSTYTSLIWAIYPSGSLSQYYKANDDNGVRPVINLKADVKISSGDGTSIAPYKID